MDPFQKNKKGRVLHHCSIWKREENYNRNKQVSSADRESVAPIKYTPHTNERGQQTSEVFHHIPTALRLGQRHRKRLEYIPD